MKVIYPREYEQTAPKSNLVLFDDIDYIPNNLGLYDEIIIIVSHNEGCDKLNYKSWFDMESGIHYVTTFIDCRYESINLKLLISNFGKMEEIWNNEG